ncbi:hypothetical protein D770_16460 [Flammeovirgaceae bacterium 311]|nr:hypothetical protein D770_16460 [Flammeovirgaceae bacterium 311]
MKHLLLLVIAVCLLLPVQAQNNPASQLSINQQLPSELLKSRSVVIVDVAGRQESWEKVAAALHPGLRKAGIDAVAYYELGNVLSGPDATTGFLKDFQQREIQNIILVNKAGNITLTVAPIGKKALVDAGTAAWQTKNATPADAAQALYLAANEAKLHLSNFLIPDFPELFYTTDNVSIKKRFFSYPLDLKFDKLAVPRYAFLTSSGSDSLSALKNIMQLYPYDWGVTEPGTTEEVLRMKQGYPYVLLYLHSTQDNLRRFLTYAPNEESPLELQAGPETGQPLYKFYIRHIPSGEVYAGSSWDAAADWQTSLNNFLQGLRKEQASNIK